MRAANERSRLNRDCFSTETEGLIDLTVIRHQGDQAHDTSELDFGSQIETSLDSCSCWSTH
jgi:hypothetical protein